MENEQQEPNTSDPTSRGIPFGSPQRLGMGPDACIRLPDGALIYLADWIHHDFRSAFIIEPYGEDGDVLIDLFSYGRSTQIAGSSKLASWAHTNVPRNGDSGLPRDWEMLVTRWRATVDVALEPEVLEFAGKIQLAMVYNDKRYRDATLLDLLHNASDLAGPNGIHSLPIHMKENLMYAVKGTIPRKDLSNFREWMRARRPAQVDPVIVAELEQVARYAGGQTRDEIERIVQKIRPARAVTFWAHLEGYVKRTVV